MFEDMQEIDLPDEYVWLATVKVCKNDAGEFFVIMEKPEDNDDLSSSVIMLPEMVQNLIPVYLPMLIGE